MKTNDNSTIYWPRHLARTILRHLMIEDIDHNKLHVTRIAQNNSLKILVNSSSLPANCSPCPCPSSCCDDPSPDMV